MGHLRKMTTLKMNHSTQWKIHLWWVASPPVNVLFEDQWNVVEHTLVCVLFCCPPVLIWPTINSNAQLELRVSQSYENLKTRNGLDPNLCTICCLMFYFLHLSDTRECSCWRDGFSSQTLDQHDIQHKLQVFWPLENNSKTLNLVFILISMNFTFKKLT